MDFHNMKRKQLQALCKEHNIPANLTNVEMANKLSSLLKGKEEKHVTRGRSCLKRVEVENEIESESDVVNKKVKKVRFSPENETFEFVKSDVKFRENRRGGRRASVLSKVSLADEIVENVIDTGRVTRSSWKKLEEGSVVETKKGQRGAKSDGKGEGKVLDKVNVDVVHVDEGGGRVNTRRSLRNKGIIEEVKRENVGAETDSKGKGKVFGESNVDVANVDEGAGRVTTRRSLRNKVVTDEQKGENVGVDFGKRRGKTRNMDQGNAKDEKEVLENDKVVEDERVESQKVLRRSKRNAKEAEDSTMLGANGNENEVPGKGRSRRTKKSMVNEACEVGTLSKIETEVNAEERAQLVVQVDEPENFALRRTTRRKSVIPSLKKNSKGKVVREKENILHLEEVPKVQLGRGTRQKSVKPAVESVGNDVRSRRQSSELLKQSRERRRRKEELQIGDNLRRSKRNAANYETLTITGGKNGNLNAAGKKEPSKRRRNQNAEEEAAETGADKVERVPQQSSAEPRVSPAVPNQPLEQRVRDNKLVALNNPFTRAKKVSFLVKGSSDKCHEEPPAQDDHVDLQNVAERAANAASSNLEIVMDNIAESTATQHLSNTNGVMESTIGDIEKSGQKAHQEKHDSHDRTSAGTCDVEGVKGLEFAKLEDSSPIMTVDVSTAHLDVEMTENVDIWVEINIEKSPEKYILDNEENQKCQSDSSVKDFTCSHLVEPQCATGTPPSSLAVDHVHEDGGVSIHKELMLEPESTQRFTTPVIMNNTIEDSGDANENAFEKDEEAGDQDEDEKECSASGSVNEEKGISAKKEHLHKPEDNIYVCPVSSDHVDEGLLDDSCQSMGLGEKSGNSCRKDGEADAIASRGRDSVTSDTEKKIHEEDPGKPEEAKGELTTETDSVSELPQSEHIVEPSNTEDFKAGKIAQGDGVSGDREQIIAELVEYDEAGCLKDSSDEHGSPNAHDPSQRSSKDMLWNTKTNDSGTSANRQRSMSVSPDVAAKFSLGMIIESEFSSSSFGLMHLSPPKANSVLEHQDNEIALGTVVGKANSPNIEVQKQDAGIEIGSEVKGEIHSMEVPEMERKPTTVQKDGLLGSNSCVEVGIIMDDNHNSISMCEDMREKENHESCLGEESQLLETLPSSTATSEAAPGVVADVRRLIHTPVKDSCHEEQGELLRNLFATPLGVIKMSEEKENFSSDSERTGKASKKAISLAEDGGSSDNKKENFSSDCERTGEASKKKVITLAEGGGSSDKEASNEDLQGEQLGKLFVTPFSVSKTTEGKECFSCDSEKAGEASNIELLNVCNSSPSNNKEIYDGNSSKFCPENEARNLLSTPVDSRMSEMKNETSNHGAEITELPMSLAKTVAKVGSGEVIPGKGREYKKCTMEKIVLLTHDQVLNGSPGVAWPEDQLRLLFATPMQSMANCKEGETLSVTSSNDKVLKQFRPQELLGEVECGSEKVVENSSALSSDDANIINEFLDEAKGDVAVNVSTSTILCEGFSESYEVSKEQMTADLEATAGIVTGMKFIKEEKNEDRILSSGTISPNKDATDHHSKFIETILVTSVNDLNEAGQSRVKMSHDNEVANLTERNSDVLPMETFNKSEARISCSRETASTISVQEEQPDIHADVPEVELNTEEKEMKAIFSANETYCTYGSGIERLGSVDCKDQVWDDVDDAANLLFNPLPEDDEVRMESDGNVVGRANAECHIRSSEVLEEQATNIEEAQGKDGFVGVSSSQELVMHISGVQQEMMKACGSPYGVRDTVPLSEDEPAAVDPESQLFSFEMNVIPAENEDHEIGTQPSSSNMLCHSSKEAEEIKQSLNLIREQLVVELQVKGEDADSSSNFFGVLDSSISEGHEVLKESEVAATIKEYIDSETDKNLSVTVNNSGAVNHIQAMTNAVEMNVTQHANFSEPQCGIDVKPSNAAGEIDKPLTKEEPDGRKDTMERKEASSDLVTSRGFIAKETSTLKRLDAAAEEGNKLFAMQRKSTAKSSRLHSNQLGEKTENVRTILIHGTPRKADMKENAPASKAERKGCLTTVRPAKRRALEVLPWR